MNYIVFDLEWNQCPDGKEKEIKDMPFEIIEIGAVKLDSQRRVIDTFAKNIAPGVYQTLHPVMQDLIGTTMGELVEKITIESNDALRFRLHNGLELREHIERTVR